MYVYICVHIHIYVHIYIYIYIYIFLSVCLLYESLGDRWKKVYQKGVPHLLEAYYAGQVKLVNGPGFEHLGDKDQQIANKYAKSYFRLLSDIFCFHTLIS